MTGRQADSARERHGTANNAQHYEIIRDGTMTLGARLIGDVDAQAVAGRG